MLILTTEQLKEMQHANRESKEDEYALISVVPTRLFREAHIEGSVNVPFVAEEFIDHVERIVVDKQHAIVVYCHGDTCSLSASAAQALEQAGFKNVHDYRGGLRSWMAAGLPVNTGNSPTAERRSI